MTTENRPWLTEGATVAIISTGRSTGMKAVILDTVDSIGPRSILTAKGHKFDLDTLQAPEDLAGMYQWRVAAPEAPETKLDLAVHAREKAFRALRKDQDRLEQDPASVSAVSLLIEGLNRYRDRVIEADKAAEAFRDAA